jgi:microcystin degradation protein MlrC
VTRVAVAGCFHETNSFARTRTDRAAFAERGRWLEGEDLAAAFTGTRTVVGGFLDGGDTHALEVFPIFGAYGTPAGMVTADVFSEVVDRMVDGLRGARDVDALLLELHGAMVVEGRDDPETELLDAVRDVMGDRPIAAVTDLHGNLTPERTDRLDVLVGYRTNPHVDTYESGVDAARHLAKVLSGELRTSLAHRPVPVLAAPIAQRTSEVPLLRLLSRARELERRHRFVDVTVHGGYAYADVPHAGVSFTVTSPSDRTGDADEALEELVDIAWRHREEFTVDLRGTDAAVAEAIEAARDLGGPVAVADTGDNIGGGAPGDGTWLVHAVLDDGTARTSTTLCDPAAVADAARVGVGGTLERPLGGAAEAVSGRPVTVPATVNWIGDGTFTNRGPMAHGARVTMGPAAVVSVATVDVVLQSLPVQPNDPELFRSVGVEPADYDIVVLKGAAALRAGWNGLARRFVDAGTPGVTDCDLRRLPYRRLRDVWPLRDGSKEAGG